MHRHDAHGQFRWKAVVVSSSMLALTSRSTSTLMSLLSWTPVVEAPGSWEQTPLSSAILSIDRFSCIRAILTKAASKVADTIGNLTLTLTSNRLILVSSIPIASFGWVIADTVTDADRACTANIGFMETLSNPRAELRSGALMSAVSLAVSGRLAERRDWKVAVPANVELIFQLSFKFEKP